MSLMVLKQDKRWHIPATVITIGLTLLLPMLVHAVGGQAAGSMWLPLFYAPFLAVLLFHPAVSIFAGIVTPFLNNALTGMPPIGMAVILSVELVVFTLVSQLALRRWPNFWAAAPCAYLVAKLAAMLLLFVVPLIPASPWQFFTSSLLNAWPGILVLLVLNLAMVKGINRGRKDYA